MSIRFSNTAEIEFESLVPSQRRTLQSKLDRLIATPNISSDPNLRRLPNSNKFVLRSGILRVFCHLDNNHNLIITGIINNNSLQYINE